MVDVAVSQFQQWTFEKPAMATHAPRASTDSSVSSPNPYHDAPGTLRIHTAAVEDSNTAKEGICLQERYMSSEEGLSPADLASDSESEYDYDDVVIHDITQKARTMSVSRWNKGKSCDMATQVSYAFAGRPKVIELATCASPAFERPTFQQRSTSLAHMSMTPTSKLRKADQAQRMSLGVTAIASPTPPISRSVSPSVNMDTRRPSTSHSPITKKLSTLELSSSASTTPTIQSGTSSRSVTPTSVPALRPSSAADRRASAYVPAVSRGELKRAQTSQAQFRQSHVPPPTPMSPATHAFLNTDPFGNSNTEANPAKPAPHRRLRSISLKIALARIAIGPSSKKQSNNKSPLTPVSPMVPQTAPLEGPASYFSNPSSAKLRRASTIMRPRSRQAESVRGPSPEVPPTPSFLPTLNTSPHRQSRMVARGANEREPTLMIPSFDQNEDPMASIKAKRLRKRKSLMSLM